MEKFTIQNINKKYINTKLFDYIKKEYPNITSGNLNKLFRQKDIKANGKWVPKDYVLQLNDVIDIYTTKNILYNFSQIQYIYEDENILLAVKPEKIQSCNETHTYLPEDYYFENIIRQEKGDNLNICHRLDTNTKGIMIFSKNHESHQELQNAFKNGLINKTYLAFVYGMPCKDHEILTGYLTRDTANNFSKVNKKKTANSIPVKTEYTVLNLNKSTNTSILEISLHTGKTHQIRAHLKSIGLQIIGDPKYCSNEINKKFKVSSQLLFAYKYSFNFSNDSLLFYLNSKTFKLNTQELINNNSLFF